MLDDRLAVHLESAYDAFRAYANRIDYGGEMVDLRALRRMVHENHRAGGYVVADSDRIVFSPGGARRRAVVVDLRRAPVASDFGAVSDG